MGTHRGYLNKLRLFWISPVFFQDFSRISPICFTYTACYLVLHRETSPKAPPRGKNANQRGGLAV